MAKAPVRDVFRNPKGQWVALDDLGSWRVCNLRTGKLGAFAEKPDPVGTIPPVVPATAPAVAAPPPPPPVAPAPAAAPATATPPPVASAPAAPVAPPAPKTRRDLIGLWARRVAVAVILLVAVGGSVYVTHKIDGWWNSSTNSEVMSLKTQLEQVKADKGTAETAAAKAKEEQSKAEAQLAVAKANPADASEVAALKSELDKAQADLTAAQAAAKVNPPAPPTPTPTVAVQPPPAPPAAVAPPPAPVVAAAAPPPVGEVMPKPKINGRAGTPKHVRIEHPLPGKSHRCVYSGPDAQPLDERGTNAWCSG